MKILLCGGGTGGHITPILAIAHEIKKLSPETEISYIGERGEKFSNLAYDHNDIDKVFQVSAGKLRRYYKQSWIVRFFDLKTNFLNLRDVFKVIIGFFESIFLLVRYRPNIILLKGGYVGVPLGFAARLLQIPYITHDSDARASLTNSLVGRWARYNTTGSNPDFYRYNPKKMIRVGVPVSNKYKLINKKEKDKFRKILKIPLDAKLIFITGGSLGSMEINKAFVSVYKRLIKRYGSIYIAHQTGKGKANIYDGINPDENRTIVKEFFDDMYQYSGAADVVITRGSATALAELEVQAKPVIVIPNPHLTGGHQIMNGKEITKNNAGIVLPESELIDNPEILLNAIFRLLDNHKLSNELAKNISKLAVPNAASQTAKLLLGQD